MSNYRMEDYEDDLSIAMREMEETRESMQSTKVTPEFLVELERVRLDLGVSSYVELSEDMIKWVMIALSRTGVKYD